MILIHPHIAELLKKAIEVHQREHEVLSVIIHHERSLGDFSKVSLSCGTFGSLTRLFCPFHRLRLKKCMSGLHQSFLIKMAFQSWPVNTTNHHQPPWPIIEPPFPIMGPFLIGVRPQKNRHHPFPATLECKKSASICCATVHWPTTENDPQPKSSNMVCWGISYTSVFII